MPENFGSFLTFIGSSAFIGAVLSIIAENVTWFQNMSSGQKITVLGAVSLICSFVSHFAVKYIPAGVVTDLDEYYQVAVMALTIFLSSKAYHAVAQGTTPTPVLINPPQTTANSGGGQTVTPPPPPVPPDEVAKGAA